MGCHFLLQGIFLTQDTNSNLLCLLHWQAGSLPVAPPGKPEKNNTDELICKAEIDPDVENKHGYQAGKTRSKASLQWAVVKENAVFITGAKQENKQLMLKGQNSLMVFRERFIKTVSG